MKKTILVMLSLALCLSFGSVVSAEPLPLDGWILLTVTKIEKGDAGEGFFTFFFKEGSTDEDFYEFSTQVDFYIELLFQAYRLHHKVYLFTKNGDVVGGGLIEWPPGDDR
ncbi:MAG: hypothetical protein GY859_35135 [Desulfobacterales bacterium]|nr:hypothetical protein [Desulfobacterales bacterium]